MVDAIARVRFSWNATRTLCCAEAYDSSERMIGNLKLELPASEMDRVRRARGSNAYLRLEELAEKHLRAMLELRY
jgi:hypothetical protein